MHKEMHKENLYIICFQVWEIYPSITKKLIIAKALNQYLQNHQHRWKGNHFSLHATPIVSNDCLRKKKSSASQFDVTMASLDSAVTSELVGCYLLSCIPKKYGNSISL